MRCACPWSVAGQWRLPRPLPGCASAEATPYRWIYRRRGMRCRRCLHRHARQPVDESKSSPVERALHQHVDFPGIGAAVSAALAKRQQRASGRHDQGGNPVSVIPIRAADKHIHLAQALLSGVTAGKKVDCRSNGAAEQSESSATAPAHRPRLELCVMSLTPCAWNCLRSSPSLNTDTDGGFTLAAIHLAAYWQARTEKVLL